MSHTVKEDAQPAFNYVLEAIILAFMASEFGVETTPKWFLILLNDASPETINKLVEQIREDVGDRLGITL